MKAFVNSSVVDMHRKPDSRSEVVSQAIYGRRVALLETDADWTRIQTADRYEGWIETADLLFDPAPPEGATGIAQVDALWTHLFPVPDTTPHPPILTLSFETEIPIVTPPAAWNARWIEGLLLDGTRVWVQSGDLRFNPSPRTLSETLSLAYQFLGLPYRWGGCSGFGYDCSGFVQMLYRQMGYLLPRDASQQVNIEEATAVTEYQSGDLVFFGNPGANISHVAMMVDERRFIHSVTTNLRGPRTIQISSVSDDEWGPRIIAARRYPLTYSYAKGTCR